MPISHECVYSRSRRFRHSARKTDVASAMPLLRTTVSRPVGIRSLSAILIAFCAASRGLAQTCDYYAMSDLFGGISPNVSFFPPGSFHAVTFPGQIGYFRETAPIPGMGFSIQMTCDTDKGWGIPTIYKLDVAFRETALYSRNPVYSLVAFPGTHLDRSSTTGYQTLPNLWKTACYFTNDPGVLHPTITFAYSSGTISAASPVKHRPVPLHRNDSRLARALLPTLRFEPRSLLVYYGCPFRLVSKHRLWNKLATDNQCALCHKRS
jgi:hypothetical protein